MHGEVRRLPDRRPCASRYAGAAHTMRSLTASLRATSEESTSLPIRMSTSMFCSTRSTTWFDSIRSTLTSGFCARNLGSAGTMYRWPDQHARMHAQRAARQRLQLGDAVVGFGDLVQDLLDLREVELAGFGQRELAAGPVDQPAAEALLQRADVARHRRRRQPELASGRGQAAVLDDADENAHRLQRVDHRCPMAMGRYGRVAGALTRS